MVRTLAQIRRRPIVGVVALLVIAAAVFAGVEIGHKPAATAATGSETTSTTTVKVADLAQTTPVNGTIGFADSYTVVQPAGNPSPALTRDQQAVTAAHSALDADHSGAAATQAGDQQDVSQASAGLQAAEAAVTSDRATLQNDQAALSADQQKESNDCQGDASAGSGSGSGGAGGGSGGSGGGGSACSTDQARVSSDQAKVNQDEQAVARDQAQVTTAQDQLSSARTKAAQDQQQSQSKATADQQSLTAAQQTLTTDSSAATSFAANSVYTALPSVGTVVNPGQSLWSVDNEPTLLLPGVLTPWRAFASGMSPGPDVAVLNRALAQLGDGPGLSGSDSFTAGTAAAIDRLQSAAGLPSTGSLLLGAAVFAPTPLRVTAVHPLVGDGVAGGQPVLDVTSTTPEVNVALPVNQSYLVSAGDDVSVDLPDGSSADGTITSVGTVATSTSGSGGGGGGGGGGDNSPSATINVTIALSHAGTAGSLDQAPVTVNITSQSVHGVLAVPTTALLALAGGGYALEVVASDGTHHLEAVSTGLFDDSSGLVQVSGGGVAAGQTVVVPGS